MFTNRVFLKVYILKSIPEASYSAIMELEGVYELQRRLRSLYKRLLEYKLILRKINFARWLRGSGMIDDIIIEVSLNYHSIIIELSSNY